jgi:hypothetical protein
MAGALWYLLPGERLIWQGRPQRHLWLDRSDLLVMALGAGTAGFMVRALWSMRDGTPYEIIPFLFVLVPLALVAWPLLRAARLHRTEYAVTTHRCVIIEGIIAPMAKIYELAAYPAPVQRDDEAGQGSIALDGFPGPLTGLYDLQLRLAAARRGSIRRIPVLWHVPDAQRVAGLIEAGRTRPDARWGGPTLGWPIQR